jgi:phosphatidylglycerol:prolipoprotein diacylglycerol transferase
MYEAVLPYPHFDPVLLHIWGPIAIRWYALSYIAGLLLCWWWILRMLRAPGRWTNPPFNGKPPATADEIGDLVVWVTLGIIIGGRLGWVILYGAILCSISPDVGYCHGLPMGFLTNPLRIVAAWDGGMSFHGGVTGLVVALWLFARRHKLGMVKLGDLICSVAPIGIFLVRIANFVNGELWGKPTTVPWAMIFPHAPDQLPRHPSQLYEAGLEGLVLMAILQAGLRLFRWQERPGLIAAVFFGGYGVFRAFVELFREPDAPFWGPISMGQALSLPMFAAAAFFFWYALHKPKAVS